MADKKTTLHFKVRKKERGATKARPSHNKAVAATLPSLAAVTARRKRKTKKGLS